MIINLVELSKAYLEPHRHYHTLYHISRMLHTARECGHELTEEQIVAIWYHDVVYNPQSNSNEEMSALVAVEQISEHCSCPDFLRTVEIIILDTKNHLPRHEQSKLVIDLDLMGLGESWLVYNATGALIRMEYKHLTDEQWVDGRRKFIEKFLNRPWIFQTSWGRQNFEVQSRENMQRELDSL